MVFTDETSTEDRSQQYDNFMVKNENMDIDGTTLANGHLVIGTVKTFDKKRATIQIVNEDATYTLTAVLFHSSNPDVLSYATATTDWVERARITTIELSTTESFGLETRAGAYCLVLFSNNAGHSDASVFSNWESNRRR